MQDNIPDALSAAFERHYDFPWNEPSLRNERLAWRAAWASAMEHANTEVQAAWIAGQDEVRSQRPAPCLHQIQEPTVSQQLTVAQKPLSDAQIDAVGDRLAREHAVYLTRNSVRALLAGVSAPAGAVEPLDIVQAAADAASVGHLSHLLDHQSALLDRAMAALKAVESTASPADEADGDFDARIPYEAWATFVDARAALLHDVKQSPVAAPQAQADARDALTPAALDVLAERSRQISAEGWTHERDDEYRGEELALGAAWYATPTFTRNALDANDMSLWPVSWADSWFKPGDRRRELTKAGALVLAAIERIDRAATPEEKK